MPMRLRRPRRIARPAGCSRSRRRVWRYVLFGCLGLALVVFCVGLGFVIAAVRGLPALSDLEVNPALTSFVYDINGEVITDIAGWENRVPVKLDQVPQTLIDAFLATEDVNFYRHHGISVRGILRALYRDLVTGSAAEGASTITQQFARNAFNLGFEKTITRKVQEVILAVLIERRYTKNEILEMYLNQIYFGHSAYGVQSAARIYFNKDVGELTLAESALICGVAKNANIYSPYVSEERALARRNLVLDQMVRYGKITPEQGEAAKAESTGVVGLPPEDYPAAYFVDYVVEELLDRYGADAVYRGGLKIYTTLDLDLQHALEAAYAKILDPAEPLVDKDGNPRLAPQSAAVFLDPETGGIRAMVGGRKHEKRLELNRAVPPRGSWGGTLRQPGSAFKPIADYAPAIELGWSPSNVLDDSVKTWELPGQPPYSPENFDHLYRGLITLRRALERSVNTVAIKLLDRIGVETGVRYAKKLGIDTLVTEGSIIDASLAVAIGGLTQGVSVLDMAQAYAVFANGGIRVEPYAIVKVVDKYGNVLEENQPRREVVMTAETAYLVTDMLKGVISSPEGTGRGANIGRPAAGKTGTTDDLRDAWFIGYTPEIVGAIWMGYDQPKEMKDVFGATYCAPIWRETVAAWLKDKPVQDWPEPPGLVRVTVCNKSGLLPGPNCPADCLREEVFLQGRQPLATCNVHTTAVVCADRPWLLARPECPSTVVKTFIRRPEPYELFKKEDEKTKLSYWYIPEDAHLEVPTESCDLHDPVPPSLPPGPVTVVQVTAANWQFSPNVISVPAGTYLVVRLKAVDAHYGFAVPGYGVDLVVLKGQERSVGFHCTTPGKFMFYSSVYSGKQSKAMNGTLEVKGG